MLMELGRGLIDFEAIDVETALDEHEIDLEQGSRGFRVKARANNVVLRLSNIKGEVAKAVDADPTPKFWTIPAGTVFEGILGIRVMQQDAVNLQGETEGDQAAGEVLEGRFYITAETANAVIELMVYPGT